jgi:hypothetical protein
MGRGEELLVQAKDHLANGARWIKGKYEQHQEEPFSYETYEAVHTHKHCLMGSLQCVMQDSEEDWEKVREVETMLKDLWLDYSPMVTECILETVSAELLADGAGRVPVESFNDFPSSQWRDIDKVLDKAIARAGELGL